MNKFIYILLFAIGYSCASECVVRSVELRGEFDEDASAYVSFSPGNDCEALRSGAKDLVDHLADNGFPFASVSVSLDSLGNAVLELSRGNAWVWADCENAERSKSTRRTFSRLSGLESGSPVRISDLSRASAKLANSGYFEETAAPRVYRDSARNRLVPVFSMRDLSANSFEGYLTYASGEDGGWAGAIDLVLFNLSGTGRDLTVSGETGEWEKSLAAYYKEPWLFGTGWNGIVRGSFEEDSTYRDALIEGGVSRSIGFFFEFAVLGGIGSDRWTYALELHYKAVDRIVLPRHGLSLDGYFRVNKDRSDTSDAVSVALSANGESLVPIADSWVLETSFWVGTLLPTDRDYKRKELYSLGGIDDLKGYRPGFFRTRAYGITEADLQWRALAGTAFHLFFEPGLHRAESPSHGWADTYGYGLGISQYRGSWRFSLYYALHGGEDPLNGLLHFGVKTLF